MKKSEKLVTKQEEKMERKLDQEKEVAMQPKFVDVPIEVLGKFKGKNYVDLKGMTYNPNQGHLSFKLDDNHTMVFRPTFLQKFLNVVVKEVDQVEQSVRRAPQFNGVEAEKSTARMRHMGEKNGHIFVGPTGSAKYDGSVRGLVVNLDDKHTVIIDSETLSKELGIKVMPLAMEKQSVGIGR